MWHAIEAVVTARVAAARGMERTLQALRDTGRLENADAGLIAAARSAARSVDVAEPGTSEYASCARVLLEALARLQSLDRRDLGNDLLARLAVPPAVGDAPNS